MRKELKRQSDQIKVMKETNGWKILEKTLNSKSKALDSKWWRLEGEELEMAQLKRKAIQELFNTIDNLEKPVIND